MNIQLGLCCQNIELSNSKRKDSRVFCARTCKRDTIKKNGIDVCIEKSKENVKDIIPMIIWNELNGIRVLRLSSDMFPHITDPETENYDLSHVKKDLKKIGKLARKLEHRITFHPGQYNVIGTDDPDKFRKTIIELSFHADILDAMKMDQNSVMVIHGGGIYKKKNQSLKEAKDIVIKRWCENYQALPEKIKKRLVLENCEKCFSLEDCLDISRNTGIPVVYDTHHYECYSLLHKDIKQKKIEELLPLVIETWQKKKIKPKFHISEQGSGKIGHHSDFVEVIPDYFLEIKEKYSIDIDIMIEAKQKEKSIFHLFKKYPSLLDNYKCKITKKKIDKYLDKYKDYNIHKIKSEIDQIFSK